MRLTGFNPAVTNEFKSQRERFWYRESLALLGLERKRREKFRRIFLPFVIKSRREKNFSVSEKTVKLFTMKFVLLNYPGRSRGVGKRVDHSVNEDKEITKISVPPFFMLFRKRKAALR